MRILLSSNHQYPASRDVSAGRQPMEWPSGSSGAIHDLLAKGLAELGHEVLYFLPEGASQALPPGVDLVSAPPMDVDVFHSITYRHHDLVASMQEHGVPWVATCHLDPRVRGLERPQIPDNWIFVSRTMAASFGKTRHVLNGIDPACYRYREEKDDFLVFMSSIDHALDKGLGTALALSREHGFRLLVAGSGKTLAQIREVERMCAEAGVEYVGDVRGHDKAELLARARALLFPTRIDEAFGLVIAEALMSGTPVICSDRGACPELVSPDVGFVCSEDADYASALQRIGEVSPRACRQKALREFDYRRMAKEYVREYRREIAAQAGLATAGAGAA